MQSPEPFLIFTRKLNELGIRYMVTGSVAAIYYGEPRMTNDVDIIAFLKATDVMKLVRAFDGDDFYCPPQEVIQMELAREQRGHFNLIHHETGFKADIYLSGQDALHAWGQAHIQVTDLEGDTVSFAPPEYVIVRKLQFYEEGSSAKHLRDISRMLLSLGSSWSREELLTLIRQYHLEKPWADVEAMMLS
ncbi:hypothetical protein SAMN02745166_00155 [Prosthecobacter debontii]|uniref:Nucleotidyl transferase AbiEii toxin, Type IV TA system n=1 Tax=Prosthecobacter debontii TaxID=48467 RepID=A0A1T4WHB7_9BACT|nr:hypothetical protein [Prosthecobacter debontii]SKA76348.1 hypothetical protein SAMN02745166_00155 [Prosthecobacter debontii]